MNAFTSLTASPDTFSLPSGLRAAAAGMNWSSIIQRFGTSTGPIRLGSWTASRAQAGRFVYDATFGIGDSIVTASATAYGPMDALTTMLHASSYRLEILSFHQQPSARASDGTATFILCEFDGRAEWAMATDRDSEHSAVRALITAANKLHS